MRFVPPKPSAPEIDTSALSDMNRRERKALQNSPQVRKYTDKYTAGPASKKRLKKQRRRQWWRENRLDFVAMAATVLALIATIVFELLL